MFGRDKAARSKRPRKGLVIGVGEVIVRGMNVLVFL